MVAVIFCTETSRRVNYSIVYQTNTGHRASGAQPGGGIWGISHTTKISKHKFNFQRIEMEFGVLII